MDPLLVSTHTDTCRTCRQPLPPPRFEPPPQTITQFRAGGRIVAGSMVGFSDDCTVVPLEPAKGEPLGYPDRNAKPGDILNANLGTGVINVFSIDAESLAHADEVYGKGSELALVTRRWIHDEAARRLMEWLDPMAWFEPDTIEFEQGDEATWAPVLPHLDKLHREISRVILDPDDAEPFLYHANSGIKRCSCPGGPVDHNLDCLAV